MLPVNFDKILNLLFSISFSSVIIFELTKWFNGFTINVIFVIMFIFLTRYVYRVVREDSQI